MDPAPLAGVLETVLYHDPRTRDEMERFYGEVLALTAVARWPEGMAFRAGGGVVLLFDRERLVAHGGPISDHGSAGPGHACLRAEEGEFERWRERVIAAGVPVVHDQEWPTGRSFYFRDPAGNLLEIAERDIWPGSE